MKINDKKFFELAKANGINECDFSYVHSKSTSVTIYHHEIDSLTESDSHKVVARGVVNGKFGQGFTEKIDKNTIEFLIKSIKETASLIENDDPCIIFSNKCKYHNKNVFNKNTVSGKLEDKIALLKDIENKLYAFDKRITDVMSVGYEEEFDESLLSNSYGIRLKDKKATCTIYAEVTAKDGDDIKTGFKVFSSLDFNDFNEEEFVNDVAKDALDKLGATQCKSKKYPVVLSQECFSKLLRPYLSNVDAEEVQKNSSLFIGKLHQPIASKKLSVVEDNLQKDIFFDYHDDECVPCTKKDIIKKGILETYIYTLETAKKDGVEPTGNAVRSGKMKAGLSHLVVKNGRKSFDEMIANIKEGVYITSLEGLHAGMNAKSGNFSLQSQGFMIRDGKIAEPLTLITIAGNLVDVFMNIKDVANDSKLILNGTTTPSVYIKKLAVSGK